MYSLPVVFFIAARVAVRNDCQVDCSSAGAGALHGSAPAGDFRQPARPAAHSFNISDGFFPEPQADFFSSAIQPR